MNPDLGAYVEQLAKAHGFTAEQLAANRARQIHPAQVARGRRSGIGCGVVLIVVAVMVLAGGITGALLLYDDLRPPIAQVDMNGVYALAAGGLVLALGLGIAAVMTFVKVARQRRAYERGEPSLAEGPMQKVHVRTRGGDIYRYGIGGCTFDVSRQGWELVTQGARYRVYYVLGDLLSIEPG